MVEGSFFMGKSDLLEGSFCHTHYRKRWVGHAGKEVRALAPTVARRTATKRLRCFVWTRLRQRNERRFAKVKWYGFGGGWS